MLLCPWHPGAARLPFLCPWRPGAARCVDLVALCLAVVAVLASPLLPPTSLPRARFFADQETLKGHAEVQLATLNARLCAAMDGRNAKLCAAIDLLVGEKAERRSWCVCVFDSQNNKILCTAHFDQCLKMAKTRDLPEIILLKSLLVWPPSFRPCPLLPSTSSRGAHRRVGPKGKHCRPQRWWGPPWLLATGRQHRRRQTLTNYMALPLGHGGCLSNTSSHVDVVMTRV